MSAGSLGQSGDTQEVELNIAPIIDCFVVLIAFMLVSASFLAIGVLDAGISAAGATQNKDAKPPSVTVSVELRPSKELEIKVSGKATQTISVKSKSGEWDFEALTQHLNGLRQKWTDLNAVTLMADNAVEYKSVVQIMEATRKSIPAVMLGGF